jgi:hypothetical protein
VARRHRGYPAPVRRPLVVWFLLLCALPAPAAAAAAGVRVGGTAGRQLPSGFAGVSVETNVVTSWFGPRSCDSKVRRALELLGHPEIRVGGNSQDRLWPTAPLPRGERQVAELPYYHALHCLSGMRDPLLVGLNLLGRDPQAAGDLLARVADVVPPGLLTIALGNEPDLYGGRLPPPGDYAGYLQLYGDTLESLRGRFGGFLPPIAGPDPATWRWVDQTDHFISDAHPAQADEHVYGLNGCRQSPGSPTYPTVPQLLAPYASSDLIKALVPVVRTARGIGIPAQISEANSVACSGLTGVSDTPASALWALSLLGSAAQAGFSRVEFHSSQGAYDPFVVRSGSVSFRPLWYAMMLTDRLWPEGTRPLQVRGSLPQGIQGFAGRRADGTLALVLVNGNLRHSRRVTLAGLRAGGLQAGRLLPAGPRSVTLDGRRLGWSHGEPKWRGKRRLLRLSVRGGRAALTLPRESATWLVIASR